MPRIRGPRRVANKIILLVLTLELLSITLWGSLTYSGSKEELLKSISSQLSEAAYSTTGDISRFFLPIRIETKTLAATVGSNSVSAKQKVVLLQRLLRSRPEIQEVSLVNPNGHESVRLSRMRAFGKSDLRNLAGNPLVRAAQKGVGGLGPIHFSRYFDPQILMATPVTVPGHRGKGTVVLSLVNLKWLWDAVQSESIGKTGYVYVVDQSLQLLAHPDPSWVLSGLRMPQTSVPAALFKGRGRRELMIYRNFAGELVAGVSRYDPTYHWWVVVEQPVKEGLAPLHRLIQRFVAVFVMAALLTIGIVVFFSRLAMRPLEDLEQGIAQLARGERDVRLQIPANTELSALAGAFNDMAGNLDQKIDGLMRSQRELRLSQAALQKSEQQVRLLLESTAEAIYGVDLNGNCTFCNPATARLLGYGDPGELLGKNMRTLVNPADANGHPLAAHDCPFERPEDLRCGVHLEDALFTRADGRRFHAECWIHPIQQLGRTVGAVVTAMDITERHRHTAELQYQASHDSLTHLPNRKLFHRRLEQAARGAVENHGQLALLLIDLDRFKEVNDSLGHKSGDQLLKQIGPRLLGLMSPHDTLARLGGDEFALLLHAPEELPREAVERAEQVRNAILEPFDLAEMRVQLGASIGIALCPEHSADPSTLLRFADVALYQAKKDGSGHAVYDRTLDAHSPRRLALMSDLSRAIREDELVLFYQPKIDVGRCAVTGFEALVRWQHPEHGTLPPDQFVPIAELGELIKPMTFWVIERAIQDHPNLCVHDQPVGVAVNISARTLQDADFPVRLEQILKRYRFRAERLQLEITESAILTDPVRAQETIEALHGMGVSLAIDDFGTGYSSLAYLKQLPVQELKIDKSFVMDMEHDENDAVIVRSTIDLAHNLGMRVTAEGVEHEGVLRRLAELRCDSAQGYFICRPIPIAEVAAWFDAWHSHMVPSRIAN